jgi:peptidoglycan/LPS O-acetylase OafA/YrhL
MKTWHWVFPSGAILTVGGVFLYALVEHLSFGSTEGLGYAILSQSIFPSLLLGALLAIVGSFIDREQLPVVQTRPRGVLCWAASAVSFLLLITTGNVHGWTFMFIFPAFVGFVTGTVFLSKLVPRSSAT